MNTFVCDTVCFRYQHGPFAVLLPHEDRPLASFLREQAAAGAAGLRQLSQARPVPVAGLFCINAKVTTMPTRSRSLQGLAL